VRRTRYDERGNRCLARLRGRFGYSIPASSQGPTRSRPLRHRSNELRFQIASRLNSPRRSLRYPLMDLPN